MVAAAERNGRRLIVSLLDIGGNTYTTAERLLAWGFANAASLKPVGQLAEPSAPAPTFDRAIIPLPTEGTPASTPDAAAAESSDAPTGAIRPHSWRLPSLPALSWPSPLTLLTILASIIAALRARVYWINCRDRSASTSLDLRSQEQDSPSEHTATADDDTQVGMSR